MPTERNRYYSAPPSTHNIAATYIWDGTSVITGCFPPITGCFRPAEPSDFAASISGSGGMSVNVSAVAITGNPNVTVSNFPYEMGITGDVNIANKTYTTYISGVTSGSVLIPTGTLSWSVAVESGSAYINNLLLNEGSSFNGGGYGNYFSNTPLNIGCTGGRTLIMWEV